MYVFFVSVVIALQLILVNLNFGEIGIMFMLSVVYTRSRLWGMSIMNRQGKCLLFVLKVIRVKRVLFNEI